MCYTNIKTLHITDRKRIVLTNGLGVKSREKASRGDLSASEILALSEAHVETQPLLSQQDKSCSSCLLVGKDYE